MLISISITLNIHHNLWQGCFCLTLMHNLDGEVALLECPMNLPVISLQKALPGILRLEISPGILVLMDVFWDIFPFHNSYVKRISDD